MRETHISVYINVFKRGEFYLRNIRCEKLMNEFKLTKCYKMFLKGQVNWSIQEMINECINLNGYENLLALRSVTIKNLLQLQ